MKVLTVYECNSYKKFMNHLLLGDGQRGQLSRAAEALNCQVSFLSRIMKTEAHLTLDQAYLLAQFWKLNLEEKEFFRTLVEWERAGEPTYRGHLFERLKKLRQGNESLQKRTQKEDFPIIEQQAVYFSSWYWSALHFLSAVPEYQTTKAMVARLGLPEKIVIDGLRKLQQFGLVSENKSRWSYASGQFHLPKNSPFVVQHHQNWRSRAILDAQNFSNENIHYTTVMTLSNEDVERIKALLLDFISDTVKISAPSTPEDAVVLNCDFFRF